MVKKNNTYLKTITGKVGGESEGVHSDNYYLREISENIGTGGDGSSVDLSNYVEKSETTGLLKNDGTVDTNTYLTQHQDISGKANTNHTQASSTITDMGTVQVLVTYTDNSTETLTLFKQVSQ